MSYVDDVCYSLIRVLDHAALHKDIRLAGYVANLDFWLEEIRHCLELIAGYESRHAKLIAARQEYAKRHRTSLDPILVARTVTDDELRKLDIRLRSASQKFLKLCCLQGHIDYARQKEIEGFLGLKINVAQYWD